MRVLLIDERAKQNVQKVLAFAEQAENWYTPTSVKDTRLMIPGDDPRHIVFLENGYRCVFSITKPSDKEPAYRHLTVSVPGEKYPSIQAGYTIAELFGFKGWDGRSEQPPKDWLIRANKEEHCVTMAMVFKQDCKHERLNEEGICRACGTDRRGIGD